MKLPKIKFNRKVLIHVLITFIILSSTVFAGNKILILQSDLASSKNQESNLEEQIKKIQEEFNLLKSQDQLMINEQLKEEIKNIQTTFGQAVKAGGVTAVLLVRK